jgi:hypothetical protein
MDVKEEQRVAIKFCCKVDFSATKSVKPIQKADGDAALSRTTIFEWQKWYMGMKFYDDDLLFKSHRYIGIVRLLVWYKTIFRQAFLLPSSEDSTNLFSCARSAHYPTVDLRSSGMLRSVLLQSVTDVLGQFNLTA